MILSSLHLDVEVAVKESANIEEMSNLATGVMELGQERGEMPADRDPRFIGAMIIGGMRHVLAVALADDVPQRQTAAKLLTFNAAIIGCAPGPDEGH